MGRHYKIVRISSEKSRESFYGRQLRKRKPASIEVKLISMPYRGAAHDTLWILIFSPEKNAWVLKTEKKGSDDDIKMSQVEFAGYTLSEAIPYVARKITASFRSSGKFSSSAIDDLEDALKLYLQKIA